MAVKSSCLILQVGLLHRALGAADLYCGSAPPLCAAVPRTATGAYAYNNGSEASKPWVIGRSDVVVIDSGRHSPGFVYVVEEGELVFGGSATGAPAAVSIAATIVVCGHGTVASANVELTLAQTEPQQHPWLGYENSTIAFGPAVSVLAIAENVPRSVHGQFLTVMLGNSSLFATQGLVLPRFGQDAWELASIDNATVLVESPAPIFMETYCGNSATLALVNVSYADVFFVACADDSVSLPPLPGLCTQPKDWRSEVIAKSSEEAAVVAGQCLSPSHEPLYWTLGPPEVSFQFVSEGSRLFSWAVSTHANSSVSISSAVSTSNLCVGLADLGGSIMLATKTGNASSIEGLVDRKITVADDAYVLGWHLWCDTITLSVAPGSEVGDLTLGAGSHAGVSPGSVLSEGMVVVPQGSVLEVVDSIILDTIYISSTGVLLTNLVQIASQISATGSAKIFLANSVLTAQAGVPVIMGEARLFTTAILAPTNNTTVKRGLLSFVDVRGTLTVTTSTGQLDAGVEAFPSAELLLYKCASPAGCGDPAAKTAATSWGQSGGGAGPPVVLAKLTSPISEGGSIHRWHVDNGLAAGAYLLQLRFAGAPSNSWAHAFAVVNVA